MLPSRQYIVVRHILAWFTRIRRKPTIPVFYFVIYIEKLFRRQVLYRTLVGIAGKEKRNERNKDKYTCKGQYQSRDKLHTLAFVEWRGAFLLLGFLFRGIVIAFFLFMVGCLHLFVSFYKVSSVVRHILVVRGVPVFSMQI